MDPAEKYKRDAKATVAAIRKWQRYNPEASPKLPPHDRVAIIASLSTAIKQHILADNEAGLKLAQYVAVEVPQSTWLMFYGAWEQVYAVQA